jgi:hypothetical protein
MLDEMTSSPISKLIGLVASAGVTAATSIVSTASAIPDWADGIREWSLIIGAPIGVLGMVFYASCMAMDSRKKWRQEREAHRLELREMTTAGERLKQEQIKQAHDAICDERRTLGSCPLSELKKELVSGIKEEILQEVKKQTQKIEP